MPITLWINRGRSNLAPACSSLLKHIFPLHNSDRLEINVIFKEFKVFVIFDLSIHSSLKSRVAGWISCNRWCVRDFNPFPAIHKLLSAFFSTYCRLRVKTLYLWFSHFSGETKNQITIARVSYIAESQTGLYLVTSKFTVIGFLNFQ